MDFSQSQVVVTATTVVPREANRSNSVGLFISVAADDNDLADITPGCRNCYGARRTSLWAAIRQWIMSPWTARGCKPMAEGSDAAIMHGAGAGYHYANANIPVLNSPGGCTGEGR